MNHKRTLFRNHKLLKNRQPSRARASPRGVEGLEQVGSLAGEGEAAGCFAFEGVVGVWVSARGVEV